MLDGRYAVLLNANRLKPLIDAAMHEKPVEVVLDIPGPWGRIAQAYYDGFGGAWVVVARLSQTAFRSPVPNYGGLLDVALAKYPGMTLETYGCVVGCFECIPVWRASCESSLCASQGPY